MEKFVKGLFEAYYDPELMKQYFDQERSEVTKYEFTRVERFILIYLYYEGSKSMGTISEKFHLPKSTTNQTINRLKSRNLLNKYKCEEDKRSIIVELSEEGQLVTKTIIEAFHKHITRFFWIISNKLSDTLTEEEKEVTYKIYEKLNNKEI